MEGCFLQYYWLTLSVKLIKNDQHLKYFMECLLKVLWLLTVKIRTGKQSTITTNWHCCSTYMCFLYCQACMIAMQYNNISQSSCISQYIGQYKNYSIINGNIFLQSETTASIYHLIKNHCKTTRMQGRRKNGSHMTTVNYQGSQQKRKFKMVDHDSDS